MLSVILLVLLYLQQVQPFIQNNSTYAQLLKHELSQKLHIA